MRIIGGQMRGRKFYFTGDPRTRPMKDRVREAVFNLIGPSIRGMQVLDLFAGSGALALEGISRGATRATMVERHIPTAKVIERSVESLSVSKIVDVVVGDVFVWARQLTGLGRDPWTVFCCPPYRFFHERTQDMVDLVEILCQQAPCGSILVVESDESFELELLPEPATWDSRTYSPAVVCLRRLS